MGNMNPPMRPPTIAPMLAFALGGPRAVVVVVVGELSMGSVFVVISVLVAE